MLFMLPNWDTKRSSYVHKIKLGRELTIKFTAQWLLSQLVVYLSIYRYMSFKCIHNKVGTLLFRRGNTLLSLSWAMGKQKFCSYMYNEAEEARLEQRAHSISNTKQILRKYN